MRVTFTWIFVLSLAGAASAQDYDLLLKGGHVIDARNNLSAVRDVAIKDGAIKALQHRAVRRLAGLLPEGLR